MSDDESIDNAERVLTRTFSADVKDDDAEWKRIQQNTFTRWVNAHLKQVGKNITDLETDLSEGLKLILLIEVLSGKVMPSYNQKPNIRLQKLENVSIALAFLEREGIVSVNIDSADIVDGNLKLILGLIWRLILHYAISTCVSMWDGPTLEEDKLDPEQKTPKQRLMNWVKEKIPECSINNFTSDWKDGKAIGALVDSLAPGLCPNWKDYDANKPVENTTEAMNLAEKWLDVPKLLTPEEIINPNVEEKSIITYLQQFPNARLKPGAESKWQIIRQKINENKICANGSDLEAAGPITDAPANVSVETSSTSSSSVETASAVDGKLVVQKVGQSGKNGDCFYENGDCLFCENRPGLEASAETVIAVNGELVVQGVGQSKENDDCNLENKIRANGSGLEVTEPITDATTKSSSVKTFDTDQGELAVQVEDQSKDNDDCDIVINNDKKVAYSRNYMPNVGKEYFIILFFIIFLIVLIVINFTL